MPRVTVITPTYNWATVLPYSIGSVLDQTFSDFELLVIGDACTDESAAVVEGICDPRVRWHNLATNTGHQSGPNNEGIRQAAGDVIAYLGHDDLWLPRHLELLLEAFDDGAQVAHGTTLYVYPDRPPALWPPAGWTYEPGEWLTPTSVIHDRGIAGAIGGWRRPADSGMFEPEGDLWMRMAEVCGPPHWVSRVTSVKVPAGRRRDVYKARPSHEQSYWLERIRAVDDPEATIQDACAEQYIFGKQSRGERARSTFQVAVGKLRSKLAVRTRLRSHGMLSPAPSLDVRDTTPSTSAQDDWLAKRRFKGLDDIME